MRKKILLVLCIVAVPLCSNAALECFRYNKAQRLRDRGHSFDHSGRTREAIACYEESLKLYPHFLDLHQELAEQYESLHEPDSAERCLSSAIANAPADNLSQATLYRQRGSFYLRHRKFDLAVADLTLACEKDPSDGMASRLLEACKKQPKPVH